MNGYIDLFTSYKNSGVVFLDSASTTQKPDIVIESAKQHLCNLAVNPGKGNYDPSLKLYNDIENTRRTVAKFINSEENEIIFTSGATESCSIVAHSWGLHNLQDGDEILVCLDDHESTIKPWFYIQKLFAAQSKNIVIKPYNRDKYLGGVDVYSLEKQLTDKTKLIIATHVHNLYGAITDVKSIRNIAGSNIPIFFDVSQSISHLKIDVKDLEVDFMAFSGHKMFALSGIGVLFVKKQFHSVLSHFMMIESSLTSIQHFTNLSQNTELPKVLETGTKNVLGIISLNSAINFILKIGYNGIRSYVSYLTDYLYKKLVDLEFIEFLPGYAFNNSTASYGIISFRVNGYDSRDIADLLSQNKIYVRAGDHCVFKGDNYLKDSIRVSLHIYNTYQDIDRLAECLKQIQ